MSNLIYLDQFIAKKAEDHAYYYKVQLVEGELALDSMHCLKSTSSLNQDQILGMIKDAFRANGNKDAVITPGYTIVEITKEAYDSYVEQMNQEE